MKNVRCEGAVDDGMDSGRGGPASVRGRSSAEYLVAEWQPVDWGALCGRVAPNLESPSSSRGLEWWLVPNTIMGIVSSDHVATMLELVDLHPGQRRTGVPQPSTKHTPGIASAGILMMVVGPRSCEPGIWKPPARLMRPRQPPSRSQCRQLSILRVSQLLVSWELGGERAEAARDGQPQSGG